MKLSSRLTEGSSLTALRLAFASAGVMFVSTASWATPSTTYWAPSVATCQGYGVPHITYDTYYGKGTPIGLPGAQSYPIDTGLEIGVIPSGKVQAEVGYDVLLPSSDPVFFFVNGKVCVTESTLFKGAPAVSFGIYNAGFHGEHDLVPTNYNASHVMFQKSLPIGGYIAAGFYHGLGPDVLYTNSDGKLVKTGAMIGWFSPDIPVGVTGLKKINLTADIQTGKNALGGGGFGVYLYFNDYVDLLVGPVFFTDSKLQPGGAKHLWTTQIDIDIPLGKATKAP